MAFTPTPPSPRSPEVMSAVESVTRAMWPGVIVLPVSYDIADVRAHGKDERILVQSFYEGSSSAIG